VWIFDSFPDKGQKLLGELNYLVPDIICKALEGKTIKQLSVPFKYDARQVTEKLVYDLDTVKARE
jgi:hypothetical protein